jgi:hypothetical protein
MPALKIFFVHLRRPGPNDPRTDPLYEYQLPLVGEWSVQPLALSVTPATAGTGQAGCVRV